MPGSVSDSLTGGPVVLTGLNRLCRASVTIPWAIAYGSACMCLMASTGPASTPAMPVLGLAPLDDLCELLNRRPAGCPRTPRRP
jgi:hypothetical protein